jgi:hypothetical protein
MLSTVSSATASRGRDSRYWVYGSEPVEKPETMEQESSVLSRNMQDSAETFGTANLAQGEQGILQCRNLDLNRTFPVSRYNKLCQLRLYGHIADA